MKTPTKIPGFDNRYTITPDGRIFRHSKTKSTEITYWLHKGYLRCALKNKSYFIHRLVCLTFVDNNDNKPKVNHKDGDKLNNHYSNLEWCTQKENIQHAWKTGLSKYTPKKQLNQKKLTPEQEQEMKELKKQGLTYKVLADKYNMTWQNIYCIVSGKREEYILKRQQQKVNLQPSGKTI